MIILHELIHKKNLICFGSYKFVMSNTPEEYDCEAGQFLEK